MLKIQLDEPGPEDLCSLKVIDVFSFFFLSFMKKKKMLSSHSLYLESLSIQQNRKLASFRMFMIECSISFLGSICYFNIQQYLALLAVNEFFNDHKCSEYGSCN